MLSSEEKKKHCAKVGAQLSWRVRKRKHSMLRTSFIIMLSSVPGWASATSPSNSYRRLQKCPAASATWRSVSIHIGIRYVVIRGSTKSSPRSCRKTEISISSISVYPSRRFPQMDQLCCGPSRTGGFAQDGGYNWRCEFVSRIHFLCVICGVRNIDILSVRQTGILPVSSLFAKDDSRLRASWAHRLKSLCSGNSPKTTYGFGVPLSFRTRAGTCFVHGHGWLLEVAG